MIIKAQVDFFFEKGWSERRRRTRRLRLSQEAKESLPRRAWSGRLIAAYKSRYTKFKRSP